MRPRRLSIENFGPYRQKADIDFTSLGEFFLICGPTGSGKSTLFDAMAYALFGQAPGARKGYESELVSDFAQPGAIPQVEFEFSLSGMVYRIIRRAPYKRPKRKGGLGDVPPSASLFIASSNAEDSLSGWKSLADGVKASNDAIAGLIGLTAEEFNKIILLPQGEFQRFLEMESTERSAVLEKLFPVDLYERITELAKTKTDEAKVKTQSLGAELDRLGRELGENPEAVLLSQKTELQGHLAAEAEAGSALAAVEMRIERAKDWAARRARAEAAALALRALEAAGPEEEARLERIGKARAAAAILPIARACSEAKARADKLSGQARALADETTALEAQAPEDTITRERLQALKADNAEGRQKLFGLEKACELWQRRQNAIEESRKAREEEEKASLLFTSQKATVDTLAKAVEALRLPPHEERKLRANWEALRHRQSLFTALLDEGRRRQRLLSDKDSLQGKRAEAAKAASEAEVRLHASEKQILALEEKASRSRALFAAGNLALGLQHGKPCPVCGSMEHPAPALSIGEGEIPSAAELAKARAVRIKAGEELASLSATLQHLESRFQDLEKELFSSEQEMAHRAEAIGELFPVTMEKGLSAQDSHEAGLFLDDMKLLVEKTAEEVTKAETLIRSNDERRRKLEEAEAEHSAAQANLDRLRLQAEAAGRQLASSLRGLAEIERDSGIEDPSPARDALAAELEVRQKEIDTLQAGIDSRQDALSRAKAKLETLGPEVESAFETLKNEKKRLQEALGTENGFDDEELGRILGEFEKNSLSPVNLAKEERMAADYREALAAARAEAAATAEASNDISTQGNEVMNLEDLQSAQNQARQYLEKARSRVDALRISMDRLEKSLSRRSDLLRDLDAADEGSRGLYGLSELLRGELAGRRLPFKNFVLAMYFSQVVHRASIHLSRMSEGRYYLKADEGQTGGRGKVGLGLRVLDSWTGLDRPSSTLSGGEKFLTSISLALGLADSLREQSGAVSLESVFIDEGFGSLDEESLDRAIRVLDKIRGSRIIGIVSHVPELKARIPSRIEVEKTTTGSTLGQYSGLFGH